MVSIPDVPGATSLVPEHLLALNMKADRSEEADTKAHLAFLHLLAIHDSEDRDIDATIRQLNRDFRYTVGWQDLLINLSTDLEPYMHCERQWTYRRQRCPQEDLIGVKLFDELRPNDGIIHSLPAFRKNFDDFGSSVLKNLDWTNVGVAGGSMLACLTDDNFGELLKNRNIDLFIWGLDATEMQRKLRHINQTIVANTPNFGSTYVVERSVGAVTFVPISSDGGRKIQVVLRGYDNPAAVLSSFDIDPACIFFDGKEVWLSPRAVRALYTGYTTTVGAISSSFAARILKYATRGYGVLVRPDDSIPDAEATLRSMDAIARSKQHWVFAEHYNLPRTGTSNFKKTFDIVKARTTVDWTHSFSALATLAALWNLAYATVKLSELMDEVGVASHIYGLYEGSETIMGFFDPEEWLTVLESISPSLKTRVGRQRGCIWKANNRSITKEPLHLLVILPLGLREQLNSTGKFDNVVRMRNTDEVEDVDGDKLEICLWTVKGRKMWQVKSGMDSAVHQLLVAASMLTAWTIWKMSSGAPWRKMHYGRSLYNAQVFSCHAGLTRTGDYDMWVRS